MGPMDRLAHQAMAGFKALDEAALAEGAIPKKYKELMPIAVALTTHPIASRYTGRRLSPRARPTPSSPRPCS